MKISLKDLQKAIEAIKSAKTNENIEVSLDSRDKALVFRYFDDLNQDEIKIVLFDAENNIFPKIIKSERL